ncbi:CsgG/HfaB family protein [Thalassospira australica]|uniref:CsgG/HfaB family protein n=1 Tax=Thalassospira australica TaxID=1528106 RepID=UPI00384D68D4
MFRKIAAAALTLTSLSGCAAGVGSYSGNGIDPMVSFPVTDNETPYSLCLRQLSKIEAKRLPIFAVGEIADKTGQVNYDENGHAVSQGTTEMVMSALYKSGRANLVERFDLRIPLAEVRLAEQGRLTRTVEEYGKIPASDFILVGAVTELNYNILSEGAQLFVRGIGGGGRTIVINVAMDLRVIDSRNFAVRYVSSLQKQVLGYEISAGIFRFFGINLVEFDAGRIRNEPLQLGVRAVAEMGVYQIMTDFLGLPQTPECTLNKGSDMSEHLERFSSPADGQQE